MSVSAVELPLHSQTGNTTAATVAKFSTTSVHPSRFPSLILVSLSPSEFVIAATQNFRARMNGRACMIFTFLTVVLNLRRDKGHRHSTSLYSPRNSHARDLFDAELQRAIQLSLQEVGASSASTKRPGYVPYQPQPYSQPSEPPVIDRTTYPDRDRRRSAPPASAIADDDDDPDLRAAIEASLREASIPKPGAPTEMPSAGDVGYPSSYPSAVTPTPSVPKIPNYELEPLEADVILTFGQTVEQVQSQGGRDMSRYPAVSELFDKANGLRPKLAMSLDDTGRKERRCSFHPSMFSPLKLALVAFQS